MVGFGPGGKEDRTQRAQKAIQDSNRIIGYTKYIDCIADLIEGKEVVSTGMMHEIQRCQIALQYAAQGETVALVCSGDPGVYGMAGLVLELAAKEKSMVKIEIIPGITAANAAAALVGAPLMLDYAVVSLSDLLVPWHTIALRLRALAGADFVTVLYNPRSKTRIHQLEDAVKIFREFRCSTTPVALITSMGTSDQTIIHTDLANLLLCDVTMRSVVIIGNSSSIRYEQWFITPRGYPV